MSTVAAASRALVPAVDSKLFAALIASTALVVPTAMAASTSPSPNHPRVMAWYFTLRQPWFKPPDWVIPVAWTGIESALAVSAYRLIRAPASPERGRALGWLGLNVGMIGGWSQLFFGYRSLAISTVAAAGMIATGAVFVREAQKVDPVAARAGLPFVTWVAFATLLTAAIWRLNR